MNVKYLIIYMFLLNHSYLWSDEFHIDGPHTTFSYGLTSYSQSFPSLGLEKRISVSLGADIFRDKSFLSNIQSHPVDRNSSSCISCHVGDGRGRVHNLDLDFSGISIINNPMSFHFYRYPEYSLLFWKKISDIKWKISEVVHLSGGDKVELIYPVIFIDGIERKVNIRNSPGVYGLGLLELIQGEDIIDYSKKSHYLKYGVKGIASKVYDTFLLKPEVGKFGWKGRFSKIDNQVMSALSDELGLDTSNHSQVLSDSTVANLSEYIRSLAVPARTYSKLLENNNGEKLFIESGCTMCHKPGWEISFDSKHINIYPFTDLLLHDMGDALQDNSLSNNARYWKTPALWGIGMQRSVAVGVGYLHDGRARTVLEAILWHGGEATYSLNKFKALSKVDRDSMLSFIDSL